MDVRAKQLLSCLAGLFFLNLRGGGFAPHHLSHYALARKQQATEAEHDIAISDIAKAEQAAKSKDTSKIAKYLKSAGSWTLDIASKIGVRVAIEAMKMAAVIK